MHKKHYFQFLTLPFFPYLVSGPANVVSCGSGVQSRNSQSVVPDPLACVPVDGRAMQEDQIWVEIQSHLGFHKKA